MKNLLYYSTTYCARQKNTSKNKKSKSNYSVVINGTVTSLDLC